MSPVRALHELSVLPWRLTVASFLVIVLLASHGGGGGAARRDAPVGVGADGIVLGAGVVVEGACAGGPSTAAASWRRDHGASAEWQTACGPILGAAGGGRHRATGRAGQGRAGRARASQSQTAAKRLQVVRWRLHCVHSSPDDGVRCLPCLEPSAIYPLGSQNSNPEESPSTLSCARPDPHTHASLCPSRLTGSSRALVPAVFRGPLCSAVARAAHSGAASDAPWRLRSTRPRYLRLQGK